MLTFSRRRATTIGRTTFCDTCAQVCTPECRAAARAEQARTRALAFTLPR